MNISMLFVRLLFLFLTILFSISLAIQNFTNEPIAITVALGVLGGILLTSVIIGADLALQRFNLRSFNTATIGLFFGYLMGFAILSILDAILDRISDFRFSSIALFSLYLYHLFWAGSNRSRCRGNSHEHPFHRV